MNELLSNPFNTLSHPTAVQTNLPALALFSKFDPTGRYVASARATGSADVWDLETRNSIRWLDGHVKPVTSIDWSHKSRYLLTSSKDWNVVVWDLASTCDPPQRYSTLRFDAPVVSASFHPKNSRIILVLLTTGEAYLCDSRKATRSRTMLKEIVDDDSDDEEMKGEPSSRSRTHMTVARFDPAGKHIFIGTSNGTLLVFRTRTKTMIARHRISGANVMKGIEFTKNGRRLVTNSSDRTLRHFVTPTYSEAVEDGTAPGGVLEQDLEPTHRFNDPINKTAWHAMAYSPDGEWLAGGAADPAAHKIYVWDLSNDGQFASTLDGGREPLVHLHWHPLKSLIASTTNQGNIFIWHSPNPERWGAFAGGFEEVDENVEYEEREDEFDIEDEVVLLERKMKAEEEDVDILGMSVATSPPNARSSVGVHGPSSASAYASSAPTRSGSVNERAGSNERDPTAAQQSGAAGAGAVTNSGDSGMRVDTPDGLPDGHGGGGALTKEKEKEKEETPGIASVMDQDPDALWAGEEPDDDVPGLWKMKILIEGDDEE
ncbi:WD40 repeat-like protein [Coprinopsis marcescibilis]|uniref:WD40 repeat-like protein n=1 Tax=Coprinopsis marcescibilis TaxID=230819 RepID=A0A5C3L6I2_COPMA|nr:WD40 repeat-like protein [Coprinopsis marcescibilis]